MSGQALEEGPRSRAALVAAALAAALFAASVWVFYPGLVSYDSILQFHEAESGRFTTTHPPLMAATWRLLLPVGGGALPMLALEQLLYWAGFLLLALYCVRASNRRWAPLAVLAGLWPLLLSFSGVIWKDVILAASWGSASALLLLASSERRHGSLFWIMWAASAALLLFGTAMRHNAAPAAIVLALALAGLLPFPNGVRASVVALLAIITLFVVPVSSRILQASDSRPIENLISWDLTGISYFSGRDYRPLPPGEKARPSCYSPRLFDACPVVAFRSSGDARSQWGRAVADEPVAYLKHRALVFSMLMRFGCFHCRPYIWEFGDRRGGSDLAYRDNAARSALGYVVRAMGYTPLGRPYLWLALAIGLTAILWKPRAEPDRRMLALISLSGAVYALTYFPAAVTDEFRYVYWLIFSVILVAAACLFTARITRSDLIRFLIAPVLLLVVLDTAVQIIAPTDGIAPSMTTNY